MYRDPKNVIEAMEERPSSVSVDVVPHLWVEGSSTDILQWRCQIAIDNVVVPASGLTDLSFNWVVDGMNVNESSPVLGRESMPMRKYAPGETADTVERRIWCDIDTEK